MEDNLNADICRVCRCEATPDKPLYHPCICTGSIKYIHQECLVQWLRYSEKEFCELCNHRFSFIPIYAPDMPKRLPMRDIVSVLGRCLATAARYWFQYTVVAIAWLGIIPLTAYRIYMFLFSHSFEHILNITTDFYKTDSLFADGFYGCCVVLCTLCTFFFLIWLREQIMRIGAPEWLERPAIFFARPGEERAAVQVGPRAEAIAIAEPENPALEDANNNNQPNNNINNNNFDMDLDNDNIDDQEEDDLNEEVEDVVGHGQADNLENQLAVAQDWNPVVEWDRGAEDFTWERILGLDGTFAFLENVFWVITLNTLFIILFAFVPYHMGMQVFKKMNVEKLVTPQFDRFIVIFIGYMLIGFCLFSLHVLCSLTRFNRLQRVFGICYIIVKVALLATLEVGIFPTAVGWWLDICSLPLFDSTLQSRINTFFATPGTSIFVHWLVGMICIFYFVSFILMVKEIVRPGIFWFINNLNDPNFNPVNEMINLPIHLHLQRCIFSFGIFGLTILLLLYLPICVIQNVLPNFLPYNHISSNDSPFTELLIELFLFQLVLPALIDHNDHNNSRKFIKLVIRTWCQVAAFVLDLKSYLFGEDPEANQERAEAPEGAEVGVDPESSQRYYKPRLFYLRVTVLTIGFGITLLLVGSFILTVPVMVGRFIISYWFGDIRVNEFNTAACGIYVNVIAIHVITMLVRGVRRGWSQIVRKVVEWIPILCKVFIAATLLLGVIPLLVGLLFDVIILMPIRVPLDQTPVFYLWQDWAFGVLLTNVICAITMMTDLRFKETLEQIYNNGIANINLKMIVFDLASPNISVVGLILALPYVMTNTSLSLLGASFELQNLVNRRVHSILFILVLGFFLSKYQINKFTRFYEHIRNDKYLVGRRLVNYEPNKAK